MDYDGDQGCGMGGMGGMDPNDLFSMFFGGGMGGGMNDFGGFKTSGGRGRGGQTFTFRMG
jgi:hypothetical protein